MNGLTRRGLLALAGGTALARPAAAQNDDSLDRPVRRLYSGLEAAMKAGAGASFTERFDLLAPAVDSAFDLETVLKVSVGLRWEQMDADTRARLLKVFRRFTVATYVANFDKDNGEHFEVLPGAREMGADRIVATEMVGGGQNVRLDYVMRQIGDSWRAVDVLLEGTISRVAVQRSDFRKILTAGDAPALIASLNKKIADLSNGALSS